MLAVDTNLIVRYVTRDDRRQSAVAGRIMRDDSVWISKTVILETEWVLRGVYDFPEAEVLDAIEAVLGLPNVTVEDAPAVARAISWARAGIDLADALHAASLGPAKGFVTFDSDLIKQGRRLSLEMIGPA